MDTTPKQKERAMDIGSLLSPPEPRQALDTFSSPKSLTMSREPSSTGSKGRPLPIGAHNVALATKQPEPISPPISPQTPLTTPSAVRLDEGVTDPLLYSSQEDAVVSVKPLFPLSQESAIEEHIAKNGKICRTEDYQLVLNVLSNLPFHSTVGDNYRANPLKWRQMAIRDMEFYDDIARKKRAINNAQPAGRPTPRRLAPAPEGGVRKKVTVPRVQRQPKPRRSPQEHVFSEYTFPAKEHTPKAPKPVTNRDDVDYQSIPDFCPPTDNLGHNNKALKADWKGNQLNLSDDPDRHLLHEAEVNLASTLRLSCAVYLASKRRIFVARVQCGQKGKEFRKTDAQQACKIDVNKASKLWTAFERVGWFDARWFVGKQL